MEYKPLMMGISGESGVGKSAIAEIVSLFFGVENVIIISTDDLHKWDRFDSRWDSITHLNPDANNLELGDMHIRDLSSGKMVYRSVYNHKTGYFNPPAKIEPRKVVIVEGLHAFYTKTSQELLDLKIFIDTDEDLRVHWKILRDTEERGYRYNVVLDTIAKRKNDSSNIRKAQLDSADVIIKMVSRQKIMHPGDKHEKVDLDFSVSYEGSKYQDLVKFVMNYSSEYNVFIKTCEILGADIELVQDGGGNISTKISPDYMLIKSSGFALKDAAEHHTIVNARDGVAISDRYKRPSMEVGFHALLGKHVIHLHPIYLTTILCLSDSKLIIRELYKNFDYNYVAYQTPGAELLHAIKSMEEKSVYFLENHGVIISLDDMDVAVKMLNDINEIARDYIESRCDSPFEKFDIEFGKLTVCRCVFPDAVVFDDSMAKIETRAANNYIDVVGSEIGIVRYLTCEQAASIKASDEERYRKII